MRKNKNRKAKLVVINLATDSNKERLPLFITRLDPKSLQAIRTEVYELKPRKQTTIDTSGGAVWQLTYTDAQDAPVIGFLIVKRKVTLWAIRGSSGCEVENQHLCMKKAIGDAEKCQGKSQCSKSPIFADLKKCIG